MITKTHETQSSVLHEKQGASAVLGKVSTLLSVFTVSVALVALFAIWALFVTYSLTEPLDSHIQVSSIKK